MLPVCGRRERQTHLVGLAVDDEERERLGEALVVLADDRLAL